MSAKGKKAGKKPVQTYIDLLYMTPLEVSAKELYTFLKGTPGMELELWEEMNILEIELSNQNHIDFEPLDASFQDPHDASFVRNRNIKTIFAINICETDLDTVTTLFETIIQKFLGFLCADTENFLPVYVGNSSIK